MKGFFFLLCVASLAIALPATDDVSITVVGSFSSVTETLGLDISESASSTFLLAINDRDDLVQVYDPETGSTLNTIQLDSENTKGFGVAVNDATDTGLCTDDYEKNLLFCTDNGGTTWTTYTGPVGIYGRGMDYDGTNYWITNNNNGVCYFQPGGASVMLATPEVSKRLTGLTTFPYNGNTGIAVTTYVSHNIWFYSWDGTDLEFLGSAPCPVTPHRSYGLAYSENRDSFFWAYRTSNYEYEIVEFTINLSSLARDSWAGIKTSF
ncbi:hypothetical protein CSA37_12000 [Candidatus Fermentibacteria bacterium]|nr:MAG: hypothetical protein CSA37_12000 [Candidatus Fermentibacteria bacterium]